MSHILLLLLAATISSFSLPETGTMREKIVNFSESLFAFLGGR